MKTILLLLTLFLFSFTPDSVYVCTSTTSIAYHKTDKCKGLTNCTHTIKTMTVGQAKNIYKRACRICFK